jgi:hypothetical protein
MIHIASNIGPCVDDGAVGPVVAMAAVDQGFHLPAGPLAVLPKAEQLADLLQREPQVA